MIRISDSTDGKFFFTIIAKNGETVATSEIYATKQKAKQTAKALMDMELDVIGDFTDIKKPGPKAKDEYLKDFGTQKPEVDIK